jgi:nitrite reductase/ring-hydroxylating ferredoxin subunit
MLEYVRAAKASDVEEGSILAVDVKGTHIILSRIGGEVFAVSGTCTHEEADLGMGIVLEGRVICPLHLSQFDLKDGSVLNPPAETSLRRFNVQIDGDVILIEV